MIDENKVKEISTRQEPSSPTASSGFKWASLPTETLLRYLDEIKACLPPTALVDMNMEEELIRQYQAVRALQSTIIDDLDTPVNQKAQVANSVASSLGRLAELQLSIYSSERFKRVETLLIRHLSKLPEDVAAAFINDYEQLLEALK